MSEKDERIANALRVLVGESVQPIRQRWWHAYGRPGEEFGGCYRLTVICESPTLPVDAEAMASDVWGPYLGSWDHEPTTAEKEAVTPEEYRDTTDDDEDAW